jgi:hypothetical protein
LWFITCPPKLSWALEHHANAPVAEPAALSGDLAHRLADLGMIWRTFSPGSALGHAPGMAVACALGVDANQPAGPAL